MHVLFSEFSRELSKAKAGERKIFTLTDFAGYAPSTFEDGARNDHRGQVVTAINTLESSRRNAMQHTGALLVAEALALQALTSGVIRKRWSRRNTAAAHADTGCGMCAAAFQSHVWHSAQLH